MGKRKKSVAKYAEKRVTNRATASKEPVKTVKVQGMMRKFVLLTKSREKPLHRPILAKTYDYMTAKYRDKFCLESPGRIFPSLLTVGQIFLSYQQQTLLKILVTAEQFLALEGVRLWAPSKNSLSDSIATTIRNTVLG